jgi:hypothetical protein
VEPRTGLSALCSARRCAAARGASAAPERRRPDAAGSRGSPAMAPGPQGASDPALAAHIWRAAATQQRCSSAAMEPAAQHGCSFIACLSGESYSAWCEDQLPPLRRRPLCDRCWSMLRATHRCQIGALRAAFDQLFVSQRVRQAGPTGMEGW